MIDKQNETKRRNNTFNSSKAEDKFYLYLLTMYNEEDIIRQYYDVRYPFACDFYIKSMDLFIECNFHWTHNNHYFDSVSKEDIHQLSIWKSKNSKYYDIAVNVWSNTDLKKKQYGDKLNYIVIWNQLSMIDEFNAAIRQYII